MNQRTENLDEARALGRAMAKYIPDGWKATADQRARFDENLGLVCSLARAVMERYRFAKDPGGALYVYDGGVYSRGAEESVRTELRDVLQDWGKLKSWRSSIGDEVARYICDARTPRLWEMPPIEEINVLNGIVDVRTGTLRDHTPEFLSSIQLPVRYDRAAKCPAWIQFLGSTLPEDLHRLVWQFIGLLLIPDMSFQKAVLFFGAGGNGKSVLIDAILALLGRSNVSSKTLHQLEGNRFAAADLVGKLANVSSDLPAQHLADSSMFKMIVGCDEVDAERKHQPAFKFRPFARMLFSANTFPRSGDATDGFFRKWIVIPFEKSFEGTERRNKRELDAELQSPAELSGALNMALQGLASLRRSGFYESATAKDAARAFRETTDPLSAWLESRTERNGSSRILCNELLFTFNEEVSKVHGQSFVTSHTMTKTLKDKGIERKRSGEWFYFGLRWKAVPE
jgi:putative DNA primase/helicase